MPFTEPVKNPSLPQWAILDVLMAIGVPPKTAEAFIDAKEDNATAWASAMAWVSQIAS